MSSLDGGFESLSRQDCLTELLYGIAFDPKGPRNKELFGRLMLRLHLSGRDFDMSRVAIRFNERAAEILKHKEERPQFQPGDKVTPQMADDILRYTDAVTIKLNSVERAAVEEVIAECDTPAKLIALEEAIRSLAGPNLKIDLAGEEFFIHELLDIYSDKLGGVLEE